MQDFYLYFISTITTDHSLHNIFLTTLKGQDLSISPIKMIYYSRENEKEIQL